MKDKLGRKTDKAKVAAKRVTSYLHCQYSRLSILRYRPWDSYTSATSSPPAHPQAFSLTPRPTSSTATVPSSEISVSSITNTVWFLLKTAHGIHHHRSRFPNRLHLKFHCILVGFLALRELWLNCALTDLRMYFYCCFRPEY